MRKIVRVGSCAVWIGICLAVAAPPALADEDETLSEIIEILRQQGLIDDEQYAELSAKAERREREQEESWTDRIQLWGDFRARLEHFDYRDDVYARALGMRLTDRTRGRYRGRLNVSGKVISRATIYLRFASGSDDPRSTNQTLGSGLFFDTDDLRFDLAYATLTPFPDGELPYLENGYLGVDVGKVKNPFLWKDLGYDALLWDGDINPEGANLRLKGDVGPVALFLNSGVYVLDENSSSQDPTLVGEQLGGKVELFDGVSFGARGSLYHFVSLDQNFFTLAADDSAPAPPASPTAGGTGGNFVDGLARRNGDVHVAEGAGFLAVELSDLFPLRFFGSYVRNLSARNSMLFPGVDREDYAWSVGGFVGDPAQLLRVGVAYFYVRANAWPSMLLDSDHLDGTPNREGWMLMVERELFDGVDLVLQGFASERIKGGIPYDVSGLRGDRLRGRADLKFEF